MKRSQAWGTLGLALALAGCPRRAPAPDIDDPTGIIDDPTTRAALVRELEAEVLDGYDRDEPLDPTTAILDSTVGPARLGAGPGDVWTGDQVATATSRWPLTLPRGSATTVVSKNLAVQLSEDASAAWVSDEVSWRIEVCGKRAIFPLRVTALYGRDGDRWVPVVEHVSYGRAVDASDRADFGVVVGDAGRASAAAVGSAPLVDGWLQPARPLTEAPHPNAFALGVDLLDEARGAAVALMPAFAGVAQLEAARVGLIDAGDGTGSVAYWVATLQGTRADGEPVRLRATFVLELRGGAWALAQAHVSLPIDDGALARTRLGDTVRALVPLDVDCPALIGPSFTAPVPVP